MALLGCLSGDACYVGASNGADEAKSSTVRHTQPLHVSGGTFFPTLVEPAISGLSRYGWRYETGAAAGGGSPIIFDACGTGTVWYYFPVRLNNIETGSPVPAWSCVRNAVSTSGSPSSAEVRVIIDSVSTTTFRFHVEWYSTALGLWVAGSAGSNKNKDTTYYCTLEVIPSGGSRIARLYVDGASDCTVTPTANLVNTGTPSIYNTNVISKSAQTCRFDSFEIFVNDDTGSSFNTRLTYDGTGSSYHCLAYYERLDYVSSNAWSQEGAANDEKWSTVRDPESAVNVAGDRILVTGNGTNLDQLFHPDAPIDVAAVGLLVSNDNGQNQASSLVMKATTGAATTVTGGTLCNDCWRYYFRALDPNGDPWTLARFNDARYGVRNSSASQVQSATSIIINVLGVGNARPTPPAPGFMFGHLGTRSLQPPELWVPVRSVPYGAKL